MRAKDLYLSLTRSVATGGCIIRPFIERLVLRPDDGRWTVFLAGTTVYLDVGTRDVVAECLGMLPTGEPAVLRSLPTMDALDAVHQIYQLVPDDGIAVVLEQARNEDEWIVPVERSFARTLYAWLGGYEKKPELIGLYPVHGHTEDQLDLIESGMFWLSINCELLGEDPPEGGFRRE